MRPISGHRGTLLACRVFRKNTTDRDVGKVLPFATVLDGPEIPELGGSNFRNSDCFRNAGSILLILRTACILARHSGPRGSNAVLAFASLVHYNVVHEDRSI